MLIMTYLDPIKLFPDSGSSREPNDNDNSNSSLCAAVGASRSPFSQNCLS